MVLEEPWSQKRMFWAFEKCILHFFANFSETKLKPFSRKARQSIQNYSNQYLVIGSFLENVFEAILSSKTNILSVWKDHFFFFFTNFWVTKLKPFSGKARQCCKNFFIKIYFVENIWENAFQSLFDHSRQSLLEIFNISNVLNVSTWIYNWS